MGQLHEVLSVESTLESASKKLVAESLKSLNKENLFSGHTKKLEHFSSEHDHLNTTDVVKLESTVDENIDYVVDAVAQYWDAVLQKDLTNQKASADIVVDGVTIATSVPATFLLGLEKKLVELRKLYESAHTLPPGKNWVRDEQEKQGVYKSTDEEIQFKEEKTPKFITIAEATERHPAQVTERMEVTKIGKYVTTRQSGLLAPLDKAMRISRIDKLILAVKKSRQRANQQEIEKRNIGADLFNYIKG